MTADLKRSIVHLDADAFFASVEQAADPRLRDKPIAVGGEKRGIIASASYEARKFGIYTPMPTVLARRLCPKLILIPGDFEKYELFSRLMFSYAYDFTPDVEIGSIDEGYFDLTGVRKPAVGIAETIRLAIRQGLKLSVSEGIASNKLVSQIASKLKKPHALEFVPPGGEAHFLAPLENKWLPGVGPKTAGQLNAAGLARIGQIAQTPPDLLHLLVGNLALALRNFARGIDERPIVPVRAPAKSYGEQETFAADTTDEEFLAATLRRMADKLMAKVREDGKSIRTLAVKVRYNDMDEEQASESLSEPTDLETEIYTKVNLLLRKAWRRRVSLRLVSLKLSNIYDGRFFGGLALDVSARQHGAQQRLADVVDALRQKHGRGVVLRGHDFLLREKATGNKKTEGRNPKAERRPKSEIRGGNTKAAPLAISKGALSSPRPQWAQVETPFGPMDERASSPRPSPPEEERGKCCERSAPLLSKLEGSAPGVSSQGRKSTYSRPETKPGTTDYSKDRQQKVLLLREEPAVHHNGTQVAADTNAHTFPPSPPQEERAGERRPLFSFAQKSPNLLRPSRFGLPSDFGLRSSAFLPLNVHSYYSFLDSTLSIQAIVELAKQHELPAIALTDTNNLHGAVEFAQAATQAGIKPIIGAELNWNGHRLCLYVQDQTGYRNLCRILSEDKSPKAEGRDPKEVRSAKSEIRNGQPSTQNATSVLRSRATAEDGRTPHPAVPSAFGFRPSFGLRPSDFGPTDGLLAVSSTAELAPFFPGRFYQSIDSLEAFEKRLPALPCVASLPIHYARPSDRWKYDIVQSIRTLTLLRQAHPEKRLDGEYHFRTAAEMQQLFAAQPELLAHSREIAERCSFAFALGKPQFPSFTPPDGSTPALFLRRLVMEGLQRRYPQDHARLQPQLEEELAIIMEVGYEEYFLVMWDILQECRRRGIDSITRGSAADSLACYCLEISNVCPVRFDLYFRRFLNKERMALNKLPDIDVDFPHDRKDDVIDLIFEKYKPSHTAVVGGFSTFQSRSAFAEVAKVLGVSEYQVRRITERLPHYTHASELIQATAESQECRDLPLDQEPYSTALQMAQFLDGFPRYAKMHPCGLVLSRQPMQEITPCFTSAKGYPTTHFDMDSVEAVGLVKMDILAQGGLAVMRDVMATLEWPKAEIRGPKEGRNPKPEDRTESSITHHPSSVAELLRRMDASSVLRSRATAEDGRITEHLSSSPALSPSDFELRPSFGFRPSAFGLPSPQGPFDDPEVWSLIASGNARAVHHIESPAMISLCKMCQVRDIDTLIAIVSVIRPGAANESKKMEFARRYQGLSPVRYPHPSLESCLRSTYGLVIYEEHILQICEAFAGLPPGRADILRRALTKEKNELIEQIRLEFADCARRRNRTESEIAEVWELVAGFRGYAFCKAHSTAYGVEAYQSAWLKRHYPAEFMAAVLTHGKGFYSPLVYILECHRLGIGLLPPSINEPGPQFIVTAESPKAEGRNPREIRSTNPEIRTEPPSTPHASPAPSFGPRPSGFGLSLRIPVLQIKGLTQRTSDAILAERARGEFASVADFCRRVQPQPEEMEILIRIGAFDLFGQSRTAQYWEFKRSAECGVRNAEYEDPMCKFSGKASESSPSPLLKGRGPGRGVPGCTHPTQLWLLPPLDHLPAQPAIALSEPTRLQRLRAEEELLGYPASGHPLELFPDIAWETYCPVARLGEYLGQSIVTCGLVIEQRLYHQATGETMKFLTIADWTGVIETELFARTYQSYGLNTLRYRVLEVSAIVEPFENGRGYTLRVLRAGKARTR